METKVLIVDDDKIICKVTKRMFQITGLSKEPFIFNSGKAAINFLKKDRSREDSFIIFLDINMPLMNGWKFIDILERENLLNNTDVYLITSSIDPNDHERANKNIHINDILIKPITLAKTKELTERVNNERM